MKNISKAISHADEYCKSRGERLTTKRKLILSELIKSDKALSAYELIDAYQEQNKSNIPAMSVYRILDFLEDVQLVHKLNLANKYVACAHICCNHEHEIPQFLICRECNHVKEISIGSTTIDEINQSVAEAGYILASPQLEMNCICNKCLSKKAA